MLLPVSAGAVLLSLGAVVESAGAVLLSLGAVVLLSEGAGVDPLPSPGASDEFTCDGGNGCDSFSVIGTNQSGNVHEPPSTTVPLRRRRFVR
jgi:hypothetical protein